MTKSAMLVEDDDEQAAFTIEVLRGAGFEINSHKSASAARAAVPSLPRPVDLVVLDRRLPNEDGEEPTDSVGDKLLDELLLRLPDTPFVIFSGYTGVPHVQFATRERGVIPIGPGNRTVDRVTPFDKAQSIEFAGHVAAISSRINELDDIEADCGLPGHPSEAVTRRLLKRAALDLGASSISARPLAGGLTGARVWLCQLRSAAGVSVGAVVIKQSSNFVKPAGGGLQTLLPSALVAARVAVVVGMCDDQQGQVMQLAGSEAKSLMELLIDSPDEAARHLGKVSEAIQSLLAGSPTCSTTVADLIAPLSDWTALTERLSGHGIVVPRGTLIVTSRSTAQHGDLHPGNILVSDGQPVLIDFDAEIVGSSLLDPLTAMLSPLFHVDSALRDRSWPTPRQCGAFGSDAFFEKSPCEAWMRTAWEWVRTAQTSDRELWSLVLAYAGRQLKYEDVLADPAVRGRAVALAQLANQRLSAT